MQLNLSWNMESNISKVNYKLTYFINYKIKYFFKNK